MKKLLIDNWRPMGIYRFTLLFGVVLTLLLSFPNPTFGIPLEEIVAKVQGVYQRTKDFKAEFIQESTLKSLNKTQVARGKIYFKNPGKLRWDYYHPTKQEIVTDGKTLWMHISQDKQVMISELSKVYRSNTSTFFLSGMGNLKRDFDIQLVQPTLNNEEKGYLLKLVPKEPQSNLNELFLLVDRVTFQVAETYFYDFYGNIIRIRFKNPVINRGLSDSIFVFTIPKGVDVIEPPQMPQN
ncbi:MAG: outer membrane lipoprotein carrier protein LolA [Deltaproteobacteria bacterium CG12_big_fil_rev_8_21_14_0_65_43_10]|nr:MAG: outer membrane lipoprotein carrier protein LolA [Deltaproteobacteria bacterium CG12_big_fil_rev_8_21_14_0_65_43_10]PIU86747.1 MAG: outer membrane lipoprotein carrier protein LolA [Deltaproteobacteria bacterium CG06_land_8_20_14_3_00_44_19]PIX26412.1 MAG: outer membrane lipoprotein carrier protein LolA [Deltaproteobacteria bacterium CG_4_8_14_3_um_filter_43_13]PIZ19056.1 MAG: outer membrane lipoprotein carrier protein LolA [Deltaproteobacteria bacterium CG_4_10_14_0_8_um_filter_43_12]PJB